MYSFFPSSIIRKTYKITADDMCEVSGTEFIEYFECVVGVPPLQWANEDPWI